MSKTKNSQSTGSANIVQKTTVSTGDFNMLEFILNTSNVKHTDKTKVKPFQNQKVYKVDQNDRIFQLDHLPAYCTFPYQKYQKQGIDVALNKVTCRKTIKNGPKRKSCFYCAKKNGDWCTTFSNMTI